MSTSLELRIKQWFGLLAPALLAPATSLETRDPYYFQFFHILFNVIPPGWWMALWCSTYSWWMSYSIVISPIYRSCTRKTLGFPYEDGSFFHSKPMIFCHFWLGVHKHPAIPAAWQNGYPLARVPGFWLITMFFSMFTPRSRPSLRIWPPAWMRMRNFSAPTASSPYPCLLDATPPVGRTWDSTYEGQLLMNIHCQAPVR